MQTTGWCSECGNPLAADGGCPVCALKRALALSGQGAEAQVVEQAGDQIGRYKLLEKIGEGGYGVVYMAEQAEPIRRRVALKIVKLGMDTRQVIARFEAERQALALMDHPNIAKVLDAGATYTGRPYFVMELVRGIKITDFCDQHHLSTKERLDLFMQVCHAVQHAHQKGIIHRDLKPSNVLVTELDGVAVPKVIDFGIAKATGQQLLTDKTLFTAFQQFIGTPAYMSPEQAGMSGADVDTRSDIYALGVLLYELLTGHLPFEKKELLQAGIDGMRRMIREKEPQKPSTRLSELVAADVRRLTSKAESGKQKAEVDRASLRRLLHEVRGDLDWIVMKCLEKDRARRYETANGVAMDLERHLNDEPVTARPPGAFYRFQKLVRRNKLAFAAATAVALALGLGIIVSTRQAKRAWQAEREKSRLYEEALTAKQAESTAKEDAVRQKQVAEYQAYVANIAAADAALAMAEARNAQSFLLACPARLRKWEWRYLNASCDQSLLILRGHRDVVSSAVYSPDGSRIVTASYDKTARIWDAVTGKELLELRGHEGPLDWVAYSPDGTRIATASGEWTGRSTDKTARIWDAATGKQLHLLQHQAVVNCITWSPNGKRVVTGEGTFRSADDGAARFWDAETGQQLLALSAGNGPVVSAAFSADGRRIFIGQGINHGRICDAATGEQLLDIREGLSDPFYSVAFSRDGTRVIAGSEWSRSVRMWDATTGKELVAIRGHQGNVRSVAYSHDGSRIASAELYVDGVVRLLDGAGGGLLRCFYGLGSGFYSVAFSPDDTRIISGSADGAARVWHSNAGRSFPVFRGHEGAVCSAAFSPDDSRIVTACSNWENTTDKTARIWSCSTGAVIAVLRGHTDSVNSAAYSPDGKRIVTASDDQTARVWDAATGKELMVLRGHTKDVSHAAFSPNGSRIVTTSGGWYGGPPWSHGSDHTTRIWDAATGKEILVLTTPDTPVHYAAFSPDGARIAIATGLGDHNNTCSAQIWDAATGKQIVILRGHPSKVFSVEWNSNGSRVVTAGVDGSARVWDPVSGKELMKLGGNNWGMHSAAFSPDDSRIVTASNDQTARVWDATTGKELLILREHTIALYSAKFSHDGTRIVTCSNDGTARVWDSVPRRQRYQNTGVFHWF